MDYQVRQIPVETISQVRGNLTCLETAVVNLKKDQATSRLSINIKSTKPIGGKVMENEIEVPLIQYDRAGRSWPGHDLDRAEQLSLYLVGRSESVPNITAFLRVTYFQNVFFDFKGFAWHCQPELCPEGSSPLIFVPLDNKAALMLIQLQDVALV